MYKIAVLGDRDSIYGFAALGLEYLSRPPTLPRRRRSFGSSRRGNTP